MRGRAEWLQKGLEAWNRNWWTVEGQLCRLKDLGIITSQAAPQMLWGAGAPLHYLHGPPPQQASLPFQLHRQFPNTFLSKSTLESP